MADREKLIELLKEAERRNIDEAIPMTMEQREKLLSDGDGYGFYADHLISSGVVVSKMETTTKWIPVTERLPRPNKLVLCWWQSGDGEREHYGFATFQSHGVWYVSNEGMPEVTHWMPLPEPPKGE